MKIKGVYVKKYISLFMVIILMLGVCGCARQDSNIEPENSPATNTMQLATQTPTPEATAEQSAQNKTSEPTQIPTPEKTPEVTPKTDAPSGILKGVKIGIDPGHQGKGNSSKEPVAPGSAVVKSKVSSGTQGKWTRVPEYQVVLDVGLMLRDLLEAQGATVYMVRETHAVDISNAERATMMNDLNTDLVIRIHCNGSENSNVYGACMLVPSGTNNTQIHGVSTEAGTVILNSFVKATGAKNAGIIKRSDLTGFNWSTVPVCLIEMGYMSNKDEDYKLTSKDYQVKCADGLYRGILEYFS